MWSLDKQNFSKKHVDINDKYARNKEHRKIFLCYICHLLTKYIVILCLHFWQWWRPCVALYPMILKKKRKSKLQGALTRREAILGEARILGFRKVRLMMKLDKTKKRSKIMQIGKCLKFDPNPSESIMVVGTPIQLCPISNWRKGIKNIKSKSGWCQARQLKTKVIRVMLA